MRRWIFGITSSLMKVFVFVIEGLPEWPTGQRFVRLCLFAATTTHCEERADELSLRRRPSQSDYGSEILATLSHSSDECRKVLSTFLPLDISLRLAITWERLPRQDSLKRSPPSVALDLKLFPPWQRFEKRQITCILPLEVGFTVQFSLTYTS